MVAGRAVNALPKARVVRLHHLPPIVLRAESQESYYPKATVVSLVFKTLIWASSQVVKGIGTDKMNLVIEVLTADKWTVNPRRKLRRFKSCPRPPFFQSGTL